MIKVEKIEIKEPYTLLCTFNNGELRSLNLEHLLEEQSFIPGVEKLYNKTIFNQALVGDLGQVYWDKLVDIQNGATTETWDYDISPEYAYANSRRLEHPAK